MRDVPKLESFISEIHKSLTAPKIVLFGSRFLGTQRNNSDIDLLVVSQDFYNHGVYERNKLIEQARVDLDWHADIFCRTPQEWQRNDLFMQMVRSQSIQRDEWLRLIDSLGRKATYEELTRWLRGEEIEQCNCRRAKGILTV